MSAHYIKKTPLGKTSGTGRLKRQIRALLLLNAALPLMLLAVIASMITLTLYRQSAETAIVDELNQLDNDFNILMDNMKYMSQLLVNDTELVGKLNDLPRVNTVERGRALLYINERVALCEAANPNIGGITFFYGDTIKTVHKSNGQPVDSFEKLNNSLPFGDFLDERHRFSTQNRLVFYGPHPTRTMISNYPVLSLTRKINTTSERPVYVYIETGFRILQDFSTHTLNRLNAVYSVVSDEGLIVFSSDVDRFPLGTASEAGYHIYGTELNDGWVLKAYVADTELHAYVVLLALGFILTVAIAAALTFTLSGMMWRRVKTFSRNNTRLETKLLIYKLNPHFLHNTLHTLKCFSEVHGYRDVEAFISALNRLLAYNMEKNPHTTLRSELDSIADYIELQKIKYEITFTVKNNLPEVMLNAHSPRFILYPLVENAILHGAKGKGEISVGLTLNADGRICIDIRDSGTPMSRQDLYTLRDNVRLREGTGIGLSYVDGALNEFFGGEGQLIIDADENRNIFRILMPCEV